MDKEELVISLKIKMSSRIIDNQINTLILAVSEIANYSDSNYIYIDKENFNKNLEIIKQTAEALKVGE